MLREACVTRVCITANSPPMGRSRTAISRCKKKIRQQRARTKSRLTATLL
jgi:hypothetical protein